MRPNFFFRYRFAFRIWSQPMPCMGLMEANVTRCTVVWEKYGRTVGIDRNAFELHIEWMYMRKSSNDDIKHTSILTVVTKLGIKMTNRMLEAFTSCTKTFRQKGDRDKFFRIKFHFDSFFHFFKWYHEFPLSIFYLNWPTNSHCKFLSEWGKQ